MTGSSPRDTNLPGTAVSGWAIEVKEGRAEVKEGRAA
jgi:hypothetical protein